jgi:hypothetical protein
VSGDLTLHGVTKPVSVDVTRQNDAYVGTVRIKQTAFGIQPIKIGSGVVRVKDELEISFRVYTASRRRDCSTSVARCSEKLLATSKRKTLHGLLLSRAVRETRQIHPYP